MAYIDWWNRTGPVTLGERFGLNEISIARNTLSPTKSYTEDRIDMKPGGIVEPGVTNYGKAATSKNYIEKGIYLEDGGKYRIKAKRGEIQLDTRLPLGSTVEDARKVLSDWQAANPITVEWEEGQKIKVISEGKGGEQVIVDVVYKTPEIEANFKAALIDYAGKNKGGWSKAKFYKEFGSIVQGAIAFVRKQEPELTRDVNKIQTQKYRTHLDDLGIKDWESATDQQRSVIHKRAYDVLHPYKPHGVVRALDLSRQNIAKNISSLDKFEKSGQTLEYFYETFKDHIFKKNLRAYLKGTAGKFVTEAFDEAGIKTKYKSILPKITEYLEVYHDYETDPSIKYKSQRKTALIKKYSDIHTEGMIKRAKRVSRKEYDKMLDLAHRQDLIIDQNISEIGIERPEINRVLIKDAELERNKLHRKNFELVDEIKRGNNVEKNLRLINENNARITKIAEITKGRLTGITINPDTLESVKLKPSNIMGADAGILDKPIKNLSPDDKKILKTKILPQMIEEARAMTPEKIAADLKGIMQDPVLSEKLADRMDKLKAAKHISQYVFKQSHEVYKIMTEGIKILPHAEQVEIAKANNCPIPIGKKAAGGRIGFAEGTGSMLACIDVKFKENPKGFFRKLTGVTSKGLDKLWKYAAPYWFPPVIVATGRLEAFKDPTKPEMWWDIMLASDAVKRWGLDKVALNQLKNASWLKRADIIGKLLLKFPGDKILTQAAKVARPLIVATETLSAVKGVKNELDLVKEYASKNNIPYEKARLAYYASGAALKPRWEGDKSFKSWAFSKLTGGANLYALALEKRKDSEFQNMGTEIFEYISKYKPEPVEEEKVPEKGEIPSGLDWALNVEAQMKKKEPQQHAAVDSYFMGGIASLMK